VPPPTESYASSALILGIVGVVVFCGPLTGIPAIICGHVARGRIARSNGTLGGGSQAITGIILGWLSLVLWAVAAFVIVRVGSKQVSALMGKGAPMAVEAAQDKLQTALQAYRADFSQLPSLPATNGEQVDLKALIRVLEGGNAKGASYYQSGGNGVEVNKLPADTWLQHVNVAIDLDGDGQVTIGDKKVSGVCAVWSSGPNKRNDLGTGDDVTSW
jgi:hypothetical protein